MTFLAFLQWHLNRYVTRNGGMNGQCVDVVNRYLADVWGLPPVHLPAADWQHVAIRGFTWRGSVPSTFPPIGSIVVWGPSRPACTGPLGHVAIAIDADATGLVSYDQNWPVGAPCAYQFHSYAGVLGWHRPHVSPP